jgi:hypothetical protein
VQQPRLPARLRLAAQVADVDLQRVRRRAEVVAPDAIEDLLAGEHLPRVLQEQLEQEELGAGELDRPPVAGDLVRVRVELEVAEAQRAPLALPARSPQQRPQAREQLLERERLGQVVVGARLQPGDAVPDALARREHEHRRAVAGVSHAPADLEAVQAGHEDVEQHRVGGRGRLRADGLAPVLRQRDVEALDPEDALQHLTHGRLVVDDQDAHAC